MTQNPLEELLSDPDRDAIPGAAPVVSYEPGQDEPALLAALDERSSRRMRLIRRGRSHGHFAVLEDTEAGATPPDLETLLLKAKTKQNRVF